MMKPIRTLLHWLDLKKCRMDKQLKINFIQSVFGAVEIGSDGINVSVVCPSCDNIKPTAKRKLSIRLDNDFYHCWVCDIKGRNLVFLLKKYSTSQKLQEYIKRFHKKALPEIINDSLNAEDDIELPKNFTLLAANQHMNNQYVNKALRYLKTRDINERDLWYFKFGIAYDAKYYNRVIMPSFNSEGKLNYFVGRTWNKNATKFKYFNCKCKKSAVIFNDININWSKQLTLVEGPFDLTKCNENATCLLGSTLRADSALFQKIVKHKTPILLALDKDAKVKMHKIAKLLCQYDIDVWYLEFNDNRDPGDLTKKEFEELMTYKKHWSTYYALKNLLNDSI